MRVEQKDGDLGQEENAEEGKSDNKSVLKMKPYFISPVEFPDQICVYPFGRNVLIVRNTIYFLRNFDGNIQDFINFYFTKRTNVINCNKYYCTKCLKNSYDISVEEINKKKFICPACADRCGCSRCIRYENLVKQIGYFINIHGDIHKLYSFMQGKSSFVIKAREHLILSKFKVMNFNKKSSANVSVSRHTKGIINDLERSRDYNREMHCLYKDIEEGQNDMYKVFKEAHNFKVNLLENLDIIDALISTEERQFLRKKKLNKQKH